VAIKPENNLPTTFDFLIVKGKPYKRKTYICVITYISKGDMYGKHDFGNS